MLYLVLIIVIGVLGLALINMQQKNKALRNEKEMQLVQCVQCGIYLARHETSKKNGACYCRECAQIG